MRAKAFVINDDNHFPYQLIGVDRVDPAKRNPRISDHIVSDISAFAVPLPEKVFLRAEEFDTKVDTLLDNHLLVRASREVLISAAQSNTVT